MATKKPATLPGTTDRRIDGLLTLLAENSTIVISGAKIAKEIGVTRQQVWRWIQKLRELGVRVKGHPSSGYHIERTPDILVPQLLIHRLHGTPFARRIYHFFKVDSTNTVAMRLGEEGEPHGGARDDQADARLAGRPGHGPTTCQGWRAGRAGTGARVPDDLGRVSRPPHQQQQSLRQPHLSYMSTIAA